MAFDRNVPVPHAELTSAMFRTQYVGLDDKILALPAPPTLLSQLTNDAGFLTAENDPVFAASEAALLVPGDKAKLDSALQAVRYPSGQPMFTPTPIMGGSYYLVDDATGLPMIGEGAALAGDGVNTAIDFWNRWLVGDTGTAAQWADGILKDGNGSAFVKAGDDVSTLNNDAGYVTEEYAPANPGHWAGSPPATVAEAIDRWAAFASNNGANPIP